MSDLKNQNQKLYGPNNESQFSESQREVLAKEKELKAEF